MTSDDEIRLDRRVPIEVQVLAPDEIGTVPSPEMLGEKLELVKKGETEVGSGTELFGGRIVGLEPGGVVRLVNGSFVEMDAGGV